MSPYMTAQRLTTPAALAAVLDLVVPEWIADPLPSAEPQTPRARAPGVQGIPNGDALLRNTATIYCSEPAELKAQWQLWISSLPKPVALYWDGLTAECSGNQWRAALERYNAAIPELAKQAPTANIALAAADRVVQIYRQSGDREAAADAYLELVDIWKVRGLNSQAFQITNDEFALRQINDTLAAARNRALVGDSTNAKQLTLASLDLMSSYQVNQPTMSSKVRDQLGDLKAEAYHLLAFRLALEKKEFEQAQAFNTLGQQVPTLKSEWRERLAWHGGLYDFLQDNYESARKRWEALLAETKDEGLKPQLYYWLARAYTQLKQPDQSEFYLKALSDDHPLSYYAVVAPKASQMQEVERWQNSFQDLAGLAQKLHDRDDYDLAAWRKNRAVARLLLRAEILVDAQADQFAKMAVQELSRSVRRTYLLDTQKSAYIYLSRLQYAAGEYAPAVSLTTELAKVVPQFWQTWPEQILVYFPRPYETIVARKGQEYTVDPDVVHAIMRQESTFRPDVKSGAGALGLMQMMVVTGERLGKDLRVDTSDLSRRLLIPELNITLGTHYLRTLSQYYKGFQPAVFGAYNAGEYAVDTWLERRRQNDPVMWTEIVPFQETKGYIKNVWRNVFVYKFLDRYGTKIAYRPRILMVNSGGAEWQTKN